ncbi:MAG: hypothetical protein ACE5D7_02320 [Fidelibacterota bacterium]
MASELKLYEPEQRSVNEYGLYCYHCGNTTQWQIDLRLRHTVECLDSGIAVKLDEKQTSKILRAIEHNLPDMLGKANDADKTVFECANCQNSWLDFHQRVIESCVWNGCPGCFHCGNWITEDELIETCSECIG